MAILLSIVALFLACVLSLAFGWKALTRGERAMIALGAVAMGLLLVLAIGAAIAGHKQSAPPVQSSSAIQNPKSKIQN